MSDGFFLEYDGLSPQFASMRSARSCTASLASSSVRGADAASADPMRGLPRESRGASGLEFRTGVEWPKRVVRPRLE